MSVRIGAVMPRSSPAAGFIRFTGSCFRLLGSGMAWWGQFAWRRPRAFLAVVTAGALTSWAAVEWVWHGFFPHDASAQTLKSMLEVENLPSSIRLAHLKREYLPDLSVEAEFRIAPSDLDHVLSVAGFQPYGVQPWEKTTLTQAYYISRYEGFPIDSKWKGRRALLTVNRERNRVFLISIQGDGGTPALTGS